MGKARLMVRNFITAASMLTPVSNATGRVTNPQKEGSGSGSVIISGNYSGTSDLNYSIQIDGAGEVGVATFRWSDDGGATWDATLVLTSTSPIAMNNGLSVQFAGGSGTDFVLNDTWQFRAFLPYGAAKLIDRDRDTEYRSLNANVQLTVVIDLSEPKAPDALIIDKHNFGSTAVIRIQGNSANSWGSPPVNEVVTWAKNSIIHFFTTTKASRLYRYWRLFVDNIGNADGYYRGAELFLGPYLELTRSFALGDAQRSHRMGVRQQLPSGRWLVGFSARAQEFDLVWEFLSATERDLLFEQFARLSDQTNRKVLPLWFNPDADDPRVLDPNEDNWVGNVFMCEWEGAAEARAGQQAPGRFDMPMRLFEIPRTV